MNNLVIANTPFFLKKYRFILKLICLIAKTLVISEVPSTHILTEITGRKTNDYLIIRDLFHVEMSCIEDLHSGVSVVITSEG